MFFGIVGFCVRIVLFRFRFYAICLVLNRERRLFFAENDVVGGGENVDKFKVLVHHTDFVFVSIFGGKNAHFLAVYENTAFILTINAYNHIH